MSIRLMTEVWKTTMPVAQKMVFLALLCDVLRNNDDAVRIAILKTM